MKKQMARRSLICLAMFALALSLASAQSTKKQAPTGVVLLDINTASAAELKTLPGIGDAYAAKIIAGRPYQAKNQLLQRKIIPAATYDQIKGKIIARQANTPLKK